MENNETFTLEDDEPRQKKNGSGFHVIYILIILLLLGGGAYLYIQYSKSLDALALCGDDVDELGAKRDSLIMQLDSLEKVYLGTVAENDTLIAEREKALKKIRALRWSLSKSLKDLDLAERSLQSVQKTAQEYIQKNDSLIQMNQILTEKNLLLSTEVEEVKKIDAEKTKQLEELSEKMEKAQKMKAFNVIALPLTDKSKPKFKAKKVAKIKVSATIGENVVVEPGDKTIYMRIRRPDGSNLSSSSDNMFKYEGEDIQFTESRDISYNNEEINVDLYYKANDDIIPGTYQVVLFFDDGVEIGETSFVLN